MNKIIIALISVSLLLTCSCGAPAPPEPAPQPPPTITEPEPVGPNMKIVAAELSWAQKSMEDFIFEHPVVTGKEGLTEYERPAFYKWGFTDNDFPVLVLRCYLGGSSIYWLFFIPACRIVEAKGHIEDAVAIVANEFELTNEIALARGCLEHEIAYSYRFKEGEEMEGAPSASDVVAFWEEYRGELHQIILRLEAAEAELAK